MNISSSIFEFELEKFKEARVFLYQGDSSLLPSLHHTNYKKVIDKDIFLIIRAALL